MLAKHLTSCSHIQVTSLFEAYAETFLSEDDIEVKAISLETLLEMNSEHKIFTNESVYKLTGANTSKDAKKMLKRSHSHLEYRINEIQWRLAESKYYGQYQEEFSTLLETLSIKVYSCDNPKSVWLCLRLLEEESKQLLIQDRLTELLPKVALDLLKI